MDWQEVFRKISYGRVELSFDNYCRSISVEKLYQAFKARYDAENDIDPAA